MLGGLAWRHREPRGRLHRHLTGGVLGSHYQDVFAFFVLILVLVFRPSGSWASAWRTGPEPAMVSLLPKPGEQPARGVGRVHGTRLCPAALPFLVDGVAGRAWVRILDFALLYVMLALGLNIVVGSRDCWTSATSPSMRSAPTSTPCWHRPTSACTCRSGSCSRWEPWWHALRVLLGAPTLRLRGDYSPSSPWASARSSGSSSTT